MLVMYMYFFQGKFLAFYQFAKTFNSDNFEYSQLDNLDFVFMRWKVSLFVCLFTFFSNVSPRIF